MRDRQGRKTVVVAGILVLVASVGCWEQIDDGDWFPQMKRQPAFQAFERKLLEFFIGRMAPRHACSLSDRAGVTPGLASSIAE